MDDIEIDHVIDITDDIEIDPVIDIMDDIEIDPVKEMQHLQAMYRHYKKLYREFMFLCLCCSEGRKIAKAKRDEYKEKIVKVIELRCQNV